MEECDALLSKSKSGRKCNKRFTNLRHKGRDGAEECNPLRGSRVGGVARLDQRRQAVGVGLGGLQAAVEESGGQGR